MEPESHRAIVERYAAALAVMDYDVLRELQHPRYIEEFPQSGERIRGHANFRKIHESYPGGTPSGQARRISGSEDKWVMTPSFTTLRIVGSGDLYTIEGTGSYPDGSTWLTVSILELADSKVVKVTTYFSQPFDPPEWRSAWVEVADQSATRPI